MTSKIFYFTICLLCSGALSQYDYDTTTSDIPDDITTKRYTTTTRKHTTTEDTTTRKHTTTTEDTTTTTTSTTELPTTTTEDVTTTTTETTTTMEPTPEPQKYHFYNVSDSNVTCIMLDGDFTFTVTYNIGGNKTNETSISLPKPSQNTTVKGSCHSKKGTQFIKVSWGDSLPQNSIKMTFNVSKDNKSWNLLKFSSVIYMDKDIFVNATNEGKSLDSKINFVLSPHEIPVNRSFKCFTKYEVKNISTSMEHEKYIYPVALSVDGIQLQAFNKIANNEKFDDEINCSADRIADIVPIAVGCALAGLIIIVLIAYIVGRRRRSAAYQSV